MLNSLLCTHVCLRCNMCINMVIYQVLQHKFAYSQTLKFKWYFIICSFTAVAIITTFGYVSSYRIAYCSRGEDIVYFTT